MLEALDGAADLPRQARRAAEDVLHEVALQIGLQFAVQREETIEKQAAEVQLRLADIKSALAEKSRLFEQARRLAQRLDSIVASVPGIVWESWTEGDTDPSRVPFVSDYFETLTGYGVVEWLRDPDFWLTIAPTEDAERARADRFAAVAAGGGTVEHRWRTSDGRTIDVATHLAPILSETGVLLGLRGVTMDVTARKQADAARAEARSREEVIRRQAERLAELSTPLIPVSDQVIVMPLIGGIDAERASSGAPLRRPPPRRRVLRRPPSKATAMGHVPAAPPPKAPSQETRPSAPPSEGPLPGDASFGAPLRKAPSHETRPPAPPFEGPLP